MAWSEWAEIEMSSIAVKELLPIVVAMTVWGSKWVGSVGDNRAVVDVIQGGYSRDSSMAQMLRCLFYLEAKYDITLYASHIAGVDSIAADALSRNRVFLLMFPRHHEWHVQCQEGRKIGRSASMDVGRLDAVVKHYINGSLAQSTKKMYSSGQRRYQVFCKQLKATPLLLKEENLCRFVAGLAEEGLRHTTVKCYLSGVRRWQIVVGLGDPFTASWPLLEYTLRGMKLSQSHQVGFQPRRRYPVTPKILRLLREFWEKDRTDRDHVMLWAACCMLFFAGWGGHMKQYDAGSHLSVG